MHGIETCPACGALALAIPGLGIATLYCPGCDYLDESPLSVSQCGALASVERLGYAGPVSDWESNER